MVGRMSELDGSGETIFKMMELLLVLSIVFLGFMLYQELVLHKRVQPASIIKCENATQCKQVEDLEKQAVLVTLNTVLLGWTIIFAATLIYMFVEKMRDKYTQTS
jgi:hypothetical protein